MIDIVGVSKRYGDVRALRHVTLQVASGELVAVLGESGSGKTTLLKLVNRLIDPDAGEIRIDGHPIATTDPVALRRTIGYVIQQAGLFPHWTVARNISTVPRLLGWDAATIRARVDELLAVVGLDGSHRDRYPDQLSGGQRQRVGVARALAARARLLLLDEPFGALDPITRVALQGELRRIHRELALTTIMVTHDMVEALTLADRIVVLYRGEVRQVGTPVELMTRPADDYVARLTSMARHQADAIADVSA
ncbi:MAG: ATP-binding protein [Myxococcales bacterium]|nr:ATP-binding protein [Myxococcales bacterium]